MLSTMDSTPLEFETFLLVPNVDSFEPFGSANSPQSLLGDASVTLGTWRGSTAIKSSFGVEIV